MTNSLNIRKNFLFVLIALLFASYICGFTLIANKLAALWPSTFELVNSCSQAISSVYTRPEGIIQLVILLLLVLLMLRALFAILAIMKKIKYTNLYLQSLSVVGSDNDALVFASEKKEVFTAGFFQVQTYISTELIAELTEKELQAVMLHEQAHRQGHDPLKQLIADFISATLPAFPGKAKLFKHYQLLSELNADHFAIVSLKSRYAVISALLKLIDQAQPQFALGYNSISERIEFLVQQKQVYSYRLFIILSGILLLSTLFTYSLCTTDITISNPNNTSCKLPFQINFSSNIKSVAIN